MRELRTSAVHERLGAPEVRATHPRRPAPLPYDRPMAPRVLAARHLNRALLDRQLLLERSALPIADAIEQVGGLQTQYAPSGYVGLWTRLADFRRAALTEALQDGRVIQATLIRTTIHMVSRAEFWLYAMGVREPRRRWGAADPRHRSRPRRRGGHARGSATDAGGARRRPQIGQGAGRARVPVSSATSGCGSTSCASRRRAPGSAGEPTSSAWPRPGSVRAMRPRGRG